MSGGGAKGTTGMRLSAVHRHHPSRMNGIPMHVGRSSTPAMITPSVCALGRTVIFFPQLWQRYSFVTIPEDVPHVVWFHVKTLVTAACWQPGHERTSSGCSELTRPCRWS